MPRPPRSRRICCAPAVDTFGPKHGQRELPIRLSLDEFEVIRLVDLEALTHEECAAQMDISRSTVQEIYESARRKIAACLVHGNELLISGGNCRICDGKEHNQCGCPCCRQIGRTQRSQSGNSAMKLAVTYDNGQIFQHFGRTEHFKIYEIEDGRVINTEIIDTNGSGHGLLAGILMQHGVNALICGGIGGGAQTALRDAGIELLGGVSGTADEAVAAYLAQQLVYDANVRCSHHDHQHGDGGACSCGEHGCGHHGSH